MTRYHKLLNLPSNASPAEIKKAYRKKAFELHPDKNKAPDAHQKFIEITVAYEILMSGKPIPETVADASNTTQQTYRPRPPAPSPFDAAEFKKWYQSTVEQAEAQARYNYTEFRKQNDAFKKTPFYPFAKIFTLLTLLLCGLVALGFFSIPFLVMFYGDSFFFGLISFFYALPGIYAYRSMREMKKKYEIHFGH